MGVVINESLCFYFSLSKDNEINKPCLRRDWGKLFLIYSNSQLEVKLTVYSTVLSRLQRSRAARLYYKFRNQSADIIKNRFYLE